MAAGNQHTDLEELVKDLGTKLKRLEADGWLAEFFTPLFVEVAHFEELVQDLGAKVKELEEKAVAARVRPVFEHDSHPR